MAGPLSNVTSSSCAHKTPFFLVGRLLPSSVNDIPGTSGLGGGIDFSELEIICLYFDYDLIKWAVMILY